MIFFNNNCFVLIVSYLVIFSIGQVISQQNIKTISPCVGEYDDGTKIDLTSLADKHDFKWKGRASKPPGDNHWYYYNPCVPISLGEMCASNAACQTSNDGTLVYDLGRQSSATFTITTENEIAILYDAADGQRQTGVVCSCRKSKDALFSVVGSVQSSMFGVSKTYYLMLLNSTCCCPNGCNGSGSGGLSGGSVLLIIFFSTLFVYIVGGMAFNYYKEKKFMLPNANFWSNQVTNTKDGFSFVVGKLKSGKDGYSNMK